MTFNWDDSKNAILKERRGVTFEEMVICISDERVVDVLEHPQKDKYPGQYLYLIDYGDYIYVVPHIINMKKKRFF